MALNSIFLDIDLQLNETIKSSVYDCCKFHISDTPYLSKFHSANILVILKKEKANEFLEEISSEVKKFNDDSYVKQDYIGQSEDGNFD